MNFQGVDKCKIDDIIDEVKGPARRSVPEDVKRELMMCIRTFLQQASDFDDL